VAAQEISNKLTIGPLVDEYFTWIKKIREGGTVLPKGKASDGINYSINQEKYLRVFLTNGKVPIDNSASLYTGYFYPHLFQKPA
jgi:hypothetical protein